jgi:formate dehydrogenase subunit gamma
MQGRKRVRPICTFLAGTVLAFGLLIGPGVAPGIAQDSAAPDSAVVNPTAQGVTEQQILDGANKIQGLVTIPDAKASVLEQPQGRVFQSFHEVALPWIGGIAVLGMLLLLALFFFIRGRIRNQAPETGIKIKRFGAFERFTHWMTATAFIVLAITGLNYVFGKRLLMPLIGPEAFATWSHWAKLAHNTISWVFIAGVLIMFVVWIAHNIPDRYDWPWLKAGGGMFDKSNRTHPPATRFNAGQKLIFWSVVLGGAALSVSGVLLLFPFSFADIDGMHLAQYFHGTIGMIMIAIILAHIYIGTLGMEGAYEAMGTGEVDLTWAEEHHSVWVEKEQARIDDGRPQVPPTAAPRPAE